MNEPSASPPTQVPSGLMIAAPRSRSGKTVLTLALLRAFKERGLDVRAAKAGPDYIDPQFHRLACGKDSVNLDPWAMSACRVRRLAGAQGGTHLIAEAAMGLFDASADGSGSAADIAAALDMPVILAIDAQGQSHSAAAVAKGFRDHRPEVEIAGILLNRIAGERHESMLREALGDSGFRVFGAIEWSDSLDWPERHLGLTQPEEIEDWDRRLSQAARLMESRVDLDGLSEAFGRLSDSATQRESEGARESQGIPPLGQGIAVASDAAFRFAYPHLLADWREAGAEISFFSPLADEEPDSSADAVFLPGGYPELHAGRLSAAERFRSGLRSAAGRGASIYGECGGYMVLGKGVEDRNGRRFKMTELLDLETSFSSPRLHLGYRRIEAENGFALGRNLLGHEFHYARSVRENGTPLFRAQDARGEELGPKGLRQGNICGSWMHVIDSA